MKKRLFSHRNPNHDTMIVPQEEGGSDDDNYFGSIGDATMKHVFSLTAAERQIWEDLIHVGKSGGIFRVVESFTDTDNDPFNLRGKDINEFLKEKIDANPALAADQKFLLSFKEAAEVEEEKRTQSEDAMDRGELIPYDEWSNNPQQWEGRDIPKTPPNKLIYMGNSSRSFYDEFPENHPDSNLIEHVLKMLNITEDEEFNDWRINKIIETIEMHENGRLTAPYTCAILIDLVHQVVADQDRAEDHVVEALLLLDQKWSADYIATSKNKALEDPVTQLFVHNYKQWKDAENPSERYASIKAFGASLFGDTELKKYMKNYHWAMYRKLKKQFAVPVVIRGINLNKARPSEIIKALGCTRNQAIDIWNATPFDNIADLYNAKLVSKKAFSDSEQSEKMINWIETSAQSDITNHRLDKMKNVQNKLFEAQANKRFELNDSQWQMIWGFYRAMKNELMESLNDREEIGSV